MENDKQYRELRDEQLNQRVHNFEPSMVAHGIPTRNQEQRLQDVFTYHDDPGKIPNYVAVRTAGKHLAEVILQNAPDSADRSAALRCVREAVLWANCSIALDGRSL